MPAVKKDRSAAVPKAAAAPKSAAAPKAAVPKAAAVRTRPAPRSGVIRARVDPTLKRDVEAILGRLGLNASDAIRLYYSQIAIHQGLPFEVKIPNEETIAAMRELDGGGGARYESVEAMLKDMGAL